VTGAVSTNDLFIPSYELNLIGTNALGAINGIGVSATAPGGDPTSAIFGVLPGSSTSFCGGVFGSCINLTFSHGAVISATMDIRCCLFGDTPQRWQITSAGDSFSYVWGFMGVGTCQNQVQTYPPANPPPYTGPLISPVGLPAQTYQAV
jgi:hypothetical protein